MYARLGLPALALVVLACAGAPPPRVAMAQDVRTVEDDRWCQRDYHDRDHERFCEVREITLAADRDVIAVDGRMNGGIEVRGWDRNEILVRAKVQGQAEYLPDARSIARDVRIETERTIRADGPSTGRHEWWSVSYELFVPVSSNLELETLNGGISIEDVSGRIDFRATNGGIRLSGLSGDVSGSTTNGGLRVELSGNRWDGAGLDVRTTNGGVKIYVPEDYSAQLESGTVNGSVRIDFPIMVQGRIDRRISTTLGSGGVTIRAVTTNGGVVIQRA